VRLFVLVRHGQSLLNVEGIVNGDPEHDAGLSERGVAEARDLGRQISGASIDLATISPFPRTIQTANLALEGREVARVVDEDLGDVRVGELEGHTLADYRASRAHRQRDLRFPGGESLNEAALRYARAFERLLARNEPVTLVVTHEIPVRYAVNAAAGSPLLDQPTHDIANATPYLFDEAGLRRACDRIAELAGRPADSR
jgi:probable phosphoglycerate mutase